MRRMDRPTATTRTGPPTSDVEVLQALNEARERTMALVASVSDEDLERVHSTLMSPLVWDLGHIAAFEDLWLCERVGGLGPMREGLWEIYDAAETPRAERGDLPYLGPDEALTRKLTANVRVMSGLPVTFQPELKSSGALIGVHAPPAGTLILSCARLLFESR